MGPDLWKLVRDGKGSVATHAVFAAAVKHSPLLGDFLEIVVGDQYRLFSTALSNKLFADYLEGCLQRDPEMPQWNETTRKRLHKSTQRGAPINLPSLLTAISEAHRSCGGFRNCFRCRGS
jgi:hypothetical protein